MTNLQSNDTLIGFIADRSGSMSGLTDATIEGFNQYLKEQQMQDGRAWMSLTLFGSIIEPRFVAWGIDDVPPMGDPKNLYQIEGMTALFDAVGQTITEMEQWEKQNDWFNGQILVVIWTDGGENASTQWNNQSINDLINRKRDEGWEFVFLGTGSAGWLSGNSFSSIPMANRVAVDSSPDQYAGTYATLSAATTTYRRTSTFTAPSSTGSTS